jgi:DNA-binding transcriptional LysR family regulator
MGLSIYGLRVYLCILECGSLSEAGRELGMTQPAVSNHLHTLLALSRPFVLLTELGRTLSPAAEAFVGACTGTERL